MSITLIKTNSISATNQMKKEIKLNQKLINEMLNERYPVVEREGYKFKKVMKLRITYEKELREEMQRQEMERQKISFSNVKSVKFLLIPVVVSLLLAAIVANVMSKVSGCGFTWEPMPQKCTSLVNDESIKGK